MNISQKSTAAGYAKRTCLLLESVNSAGSLWFQFSSQKTHIIKLQPEKDVFEGRGDTSDNVYGFILELKKMQAMKKCMDYAKRMEMESCYLSS